jgi:DNA-binding NarL/FixJ family response regulator
MNTRPHTISENVNQLTALTDRQQQIAILVCDGLSNKLVARKLGLTEGTVKIHLYLIYKKLGVRSRTDLMIRFSTSQRVPQPASAA